MREGPQPFWGKDSSQLAQWRLGCSMGRTSRRALLHLALLSAPTLAVEQFDCEQEVTPVDIVPIRSPQSVHTALARRFAGQSIVEIGTRNGDGMECYARVARHAVAIEIERSYCPTLMTRSAQMQRVKTGHGHGHRNFTVRSMRTMSRGSWDLRRSTFGFFASFQAIASACALILRP